MSELPFLSIAEAAARIRSGTLSPVEYASALIDWTEGRDHLLNAYIRFEPEAALAAAKTAETELRDGRSRGPLHGIPFGLKDIIDYEGLPTTGHSKILIDNVAAADAAVTRLLKEAGGIFMGKLATHEFAFGGPSFDLPWPPARNPWNREKFTGSSSSGSGAAVAAGFLPMALGSDTGGSVRNPATLCGIVGMKATYGRVSLRGVFPLAWSLDHVGPMTRTVEDNALMLNAIATYDPADPVSSTAPPVDYLAELRQGVKGLKIGYIRHYQDRDMTADAEMAASIDEAAETFRALGAEVREVSTAPLETFHAVNRVILLSEGYAIHERWLQERPGDYGQLFRERILSGATIRAVDYVHAQQARRRLTDAVSGLFGEVDVLMCISGMDPAYAIEDIEESKRQHSRQARTVFNVTGHPAMSVPTGFSSAGLPLGMQLVGPHFEEATVYRAAWAYEQATEWHKRHPELTARAAAE